MLCRLIGRRLNISTNVKLTKNGIGLSLIGQDLQNQDPALSLVSCLQSFLLSSCDRLPLPVSFIPECAFLCCLFLPRSFLSLVSRLPISAFLLLISSLCALSHSLFLFLSVVCALSSVSLSSLCWLAVALRSPTWCLLAFFLFSSFGSHALGFLVLSLLCLLRSLSWCTLSICDPLSFLHVSQVTCFSFWLPFCSRCSLAHTCLCHMSFLPLCGYFLSFLSCEVSRYLFVACSFLSRHHCLLWSLLYFFLVYSSWSVRPLQESVFPSLASCSPLLDVPLCTRAVCMCVCVCLLCVSEGLPNPFPIGSECQLSKSALQSRSCAKLPCEMIQYQNMVLESRLKLKPKT